LPVEAKKAVDILKEEYAQLKQYGKFPEYDEVEAFAEWLDERYSLIPKDSIPSPRGV